MQPEDSNTEPTDTANVSVNETDHEHSSQIKQEETDDEFDVELDSDDLDPDRDYAKLFEKYQQRFRKVSQEAAELFDQEQLERQTLYFYQRRNNALLDTVEQMNPVEVETDIDQERVLRVLEKVPRLKSLESILHLDEENYKVSSHLLVNLYELERVPELINDDLISIQENPQTILNWCRRHYPHLISSNFKPVNVPPTGLVAEYVSENLARSVPGPQKRRKVDKKKK